MKATVEKQIKITLDEHEANWLKCIMQNPIHCDNPSNEDLNDRHMRISLFQVIRSELDK